MLSPNGAGAAPAASANAKAYESNGANSFAPASKAASASDSASAASGAGKGFRACLAAAHEGAGSVAANRSGSGAARRAAGGTGAHGADRKEDETAAQRARQADKQADKQADNQADKQADGQADKATDSRTEERADDRSSGSSAAAASAAALQGAVIVHGAAAGPSAAALSAAGDGSGTNLPPGGTNVPVGAGTCGTPLAALGEGSGANAVLGAVVGALAGAGDASGAAGNKPGVAALDLNRMRLLPTSSSAPNAAGDVSAQAPTHGAHGPTPNLLAPAGAPAQNSGAAPGAGPVPTGFEQAVGQRLVWMAQHGSRDALLQLHPEHLGALEVHLKMDGDTAQVTLSSPHAPVREALHSAVPQLRNLLGAAGLNLGQVNVDAGRQREANRFLDGDAGSRAAPADPAGPVQSSGAVLQLGSGLVDLFA